MNVLLEEINCATNNAVGMLGAGESGKYRQRRRTILQNAETESAPPDEAEQMTI